MQFISNRLLDPAAKKSDENPQQGCAEIKGQVQAKRSGTKRQKEEE